MTYLSIFGIILFTNVTAVSTAEFGFRERLVVFIKHGSSLTTEQAQHLADRFIAHGYEQAKWLAATAKVESRFNNKAIGKANEVTMFQILRWPKGKDPNNIDHAIAAALAVRAEKIATWTDSNKALAAYNGNPKLKQTKIYAAKIKESMRYL